jgi:single-strand DNA-binding protein
MAGNFNKVLLMGNLTRDIELKYTQSNQAVANVGIAVNRRWRTEQGEQREETTFVDCEAWGKTAETMAKFLSKGRPVFIEGRLKLDTWQDKTDGSNRSKLKVVVETFQFIDSRPGGADAAGGARPGVQTRPANGTAPAPTAAPAAAAPSYEPMPEEDIPF